MTTSLQHIAECLADQAVFECEEAFNGRRHSPPHREIAYQIRATLEKAHNDALEEAAKTCELRAHVEQRYAEEELQPGKAEIVYCPPAQFCKQFAAVIRALKKSAA